MYTFKEVLCGECTHLVIKTELWVSGLLMGVHDVAFLHSCVRDEILVVEMKSLLPNHMS